MAKYNITHSCGCQEIHQIVGKVPLRGAKMQWLADRMCIACDNKDKSAIAAEASGDLPVLVGTEKQVAWAVSLRHDIRKQLLEELRGLSYRQSAVAYRWGSWAEVEAKSAVIIAEILSEASAKWWIDNRFQRPSLKADLDASYTSQQIAAL
jgi:hypothetical protein